MCSCMLGVSWHRGSVLACFRVRVRVSSSGAEGDPGKGISFRSTSSLVVRRFSVPVAQSRITL